jgi:large subunit ribosomal protein L39e
MLSSLFFDSNAHVTIFAYAIFTSTLKNRRKSILLYYMAARKNTSRKKRLMKRTRQNRPVPTWVVIRTNRKIRTNPKRRLWRRSDVNVG